MSRLDETKQTIKSILHCAENFRVESDALQHLARTLAAEVDELRAELAQVKAESLRVVRDGEACQPQDLYPTQFVLRDGRVWVNHPGTRDIVDITNNNRVAVPYDVTVQPVRLERWEDE